jgi:hypothetical protein
LRQHQHRRDGWLEANAHLGPQYRDVVRTLAWRRRATGLAVEADRPGYVLEALGPVPESTRGRLGHAAVPSFFRWACAARLAWRALTAARESRAK